MQTGSIDWLHLPRLCRRAPAIVCAGVAVLLLTPACREAPKAKPAAKAAASVPAAAKAPAPPTEKDFERARAIVRVVKNARGGGDVLRNARLALSMYPEKSRRGLLEMIGRKAEAYDFALELLGELGPEPDAGKRKATVELLLKVLRQTDGFSLGRGEAALALGRIGATETGPEILALLQTLEARRDAYVFARAADAVALLAPPDTAEFAQGALRQTPLGPGESLAPLALALGKTDPAGALATLPGLLAGDWDEHGWGGALRGLGATGRPEALEKVLGFVQRIEAAQDKRDMGTVRKLGTALFAAYGETARFDGERVWEICLLNDNASYPHGFADDRKRVAARAQAVPAAFRKDCALKWSKPMWLAKENYNPTFNESKRQRVGVALLGAQRDPETKEHYLKQIAKYQGQARYDGNISVWALQLWPWAEAGDQEVIALYLRLATQTKMPDCFTSRNAARQELEKLKHPDLPGIIAKDGSFGQITDWNRLREWPNKQPVPGLSDAFLKAKHTPGPEGDWINAVVFEYLAAESRPDVLEFIKAEMAKTYENPKGTLLFTWINGLRTWKGAAADELLRSVIKRYADEGLKAESHEFDNVRAAKRSAMLTAQSMLASRGDKEAFKAVFKRWPVLPTETYLKPPPEFAPFFKRDYGPCVLDWPIEEAGR
jgi:hypothetical protein